MLISSESIFQSAAVQGLSPGKKIGIIGAGISGLTLGLKLKEKGFEVELFDKGNSVGGRASSRRTQWGYLDHGAQFITIRDPEFKDFLETHLPENCLVPWNVNFAHLENHLLIPENQKDLRYIPCQSMNTLSKYLALELSVQTQVKIIQLLPQEYWILKDEKNNSYGPFDLVVLTAPPAQTAQLIENHSELAQQIAKIQMWPCWTLMIITDNEIQFPFGGIKCEHPVLGWIGLNHTKPERGKLTSITVQANWQWSAENLEKDTDVIGDILQLETEQILKTNLSPTNYRKVHLWRYAAPVNRAPQSYFLDPLNHLAICGDWCVAGRIEGAFLSAHELAQNLI